MENILIISSVDAPYHPPVNIASLREILNDYQLTFSEDNDAFLRTKEYSLVVCYADLWERPLTDVQAAAYKGYLESGGRILVIHNGISVQDTPMISEIPGARFTHHPPYGELLIEPIIGHPITEDLQNFTIMDEPYYFDVTGKIEVIAAYKHGGNTIPAAWEYGLGKGTAVYLMPGHDAAVFKCVEYQKMIRNSVKYLLDKDL